MRGKRPELKTIEGGLVKAPPMPNTLPKSMAKEWSEIAADLIGRGLLTTSSLGVLEAYVGALWMVRVCRKAIAEHGPLIHSSAGVLRPNPAAAMIAKSNETIARLSYEMGISAAGRNLQSIKKQSDGATTDDSAALGF